MNKLSSYIDNKLVLIALDVSASMDDKYIPIVESFTSYSNSNICIVPVDCQYYWDNLTKLDKFADIVTRFSGVGRGGTDFEGIHNYNLYMSKPDTIVFITDGWLPHLKPFESSEQTDVLWILTKQIEFEPLVGKVINLKEES